MCVCPTGSSVTIHVSSSDVLAHVTIHWHDEAGKQISFTQALNSNKRIENCLWQPVGIRSNKPAYLSSPKFAATLILCDGVGIIMPGSGLRLTAMFSSVFPLITSGVLSVGSFGGARFRESWLGLAAIFFGQLRRFFVRGNRETSCNDAPPQFGISIYDK